MSVLVVDDDPTVSEVVRGYLERAGFDVRHAEDGNQALELADHEAPDLVVLDVMLPGLDGIEVCRRLRSRGDVPIVMLTALGSEVDRVLGLEVGADDYLTKPFSPRELVLRVQSVLRRAGRVGSAPAGGPPGTPAGVGVPDAEGAPGAEGRPERVVVDGDLRVDLAAHRVTMAGRDLTLTVREFDLLAHLVTHPGVAFTREQLMNAVWGWEFGDLSTVTVHVRRVRAKVEVDPARPARLSTVWGVGYRWDPTTVAVP
ncbi:response regulator transcription factor [Spongisporangium articulatum]|uniref:Response regulator transcription factor n=1 Tax=Spongisporangium articulatum TaxID=3362603 RepID=A0ABW8AQV9_9ACTN